MMSETMERLLALQISVAWAASEGRTPAYDELTDIASGLLAWARQGDVAPTIEERLAELEKHSYPPIDLRPAIQEILADQKSASAQSTPSASMEEARRKASARFHDWQTNISTTLEQDFEDALDAFIAALPTGPMPARVTDEMMTSCCDAIERHISFISVDAVMAGLEAALAAAPKDIEVTEKMAGAAMDVWRSLPDDGLLEPHLPALFRAMMAAR